MLNLNQEILKTNILMLIIVNEKIEKSDIILLKQKLPNHIFLFLIQKGFPLF